MSSIDPPTHIQWYWGHKNLNLKLLLSKEIQDKLLHHKLPIFFLLIKMSKYSWSYFYWIESTFMEIILCCFIKLCFCTFIVQNNFTISRLVLQVQYQQALGHIVWLTVILSLSVVCFNLLIHTGYRKTEHKFVTLYKKYSNFISIKKKTIFMSFFCYIIYI